ncbi:MAG: hypothetical protein K6T66_01810 [Peptococcaceae bacterium]|nr:hypothetical protein [Peptococcaceae bacterium]
METTFDFTYFYWAFFICMLIGLFSAIYKKPLDAIIDHVEEKASGRMAR